MIKNRKKLVTIGLIVLACAIIVAEVITRQKQNQELATGNLQSTEEASSVGSFFEGIFNDEEKINEGNKTQQQSIPTKKPIQKLPTSQVVKSDIYKQGEVVGPNKDIKFIDTENYDVHYQEKDDSILIGIFASPFDLYRIQAEQELVEKLNITKEEACALNVSITTPRFANPDKAGQIFSLSFCE